jgi:hypothetical protein
MSSVRIPIPVFFAAVAFTLLLVEPEIGSTASHIATPCQPAASKTAEQDAALWYGYRVASRQWDAAKRAPMRGTDVPVSLH